IPDFKLEKRIVSRRVEQLRQEGVDFRTGVNVGIDLSVKELQNSFDAVLLAIGVQNARKLTAEGHDLNGVHYAMDFLPQCTRDVAGDFIPEEEKIDSGNKLVIILGGGFTAADCLGNINRQGAKTNVRQCELVNMEPRPTPVHEEANPDCRAHILTEAIVDNGEGNIKSLQGVNVEWERKNGRMTMKRLEDSEFTVSADIVLLAMGFLGPTVEGLLEGLEVELSVFGTEKSRNPAQVKKMLRNAQPVYSIRSDDNFMTSREGIFVAGDANRGASLVVWAIWEGREAARCIDAYLMGNSVLPSTPQAEVLV
ncbi:MAG: FAD-dependent oxidoreductase, partial [SAR324 cluster bacterium]|nr:FAD-dependent oxidoreductase [SAR324 cluster bacterium]